MATDSIKKYSKKAKEARLKVLEMIHQASTSHIASNFSIIDVATVLYENLKEGDEVVWSKGWVAATIYYFLAQQGKIPKEDLEIFGKEMKCEKCNGSQEEDEHVWCTGCNGTGRVIKYLGLVETTTPGIFANAGSMGHGLPIACGMALAKKLKGEKGNIYCIMSDGEMNEGTTWESAMFAAHHKLDNLVVIVDKNKWQAMGTTEEVLNVDIIHTFHGFGWETWDLREGHHFKFIEQSIFEARENKPLNAFNTPEGLPKVIVACTIKGKGVSFMEDHLLYHYKHVDEENYKLAKAELENAV